MNPYLIPELEKEIARLEQYIASCVYLLSIRTQDESVAIVTVRQLEAGAALAKLTGSLATLKRQQEGRAMEAMRHHLLTQGLFS